ITVPFGRKTGGPISADPGSTSETPVLPAEDQEPAAGSKISELVPLNASTVNTLPLGSKVKPSSLLTSAFPIVPVGVQARVLAVRRASSLVQQFDSMKVPSARVTVAASPIVVHPEGCPIALHLLVFGV